MTPEIPELPTTLQVEDLIHADPPATGTDDDEDDRDDEHPSENEARIRETDENTETPEEFEIDDEDDRGHPQDEIADDIEE